jgi:hypothetical protein
MSNAASRSWVEPATSKPDPVIEAYKKDVDRTLLRANLARTVEERLQNLARLQRFAEELRQVGRHLRWRRFSTPVAPERRNA